MMRATTIAVVFAAGCFESELLFDPPSIELTVELDGTASAPLRVFDDDFEEVTGRVTLRLEGTPLGRLEESTFHSDGRTGGRAHIVAELDGATGKLPVRVLLRSARFVDVPADDAARFAAARDGDGDALVEPGDGAVLPPNLGRLDVHFVAGTNDRHEVAFVGPELDLRVYGRGDVAARRVDLTAAEWDAVARTSRGGAVDLVVRSLASAAPADAQRSVAHLGVADLAFTHEVLFTGWMPGEANPRLWSYELGRATTEPWANGPGGNCLGCHVAVSRDGTRFAAGGTIDTPAGVVSGGVLVDAQTRFYAVPPSTAVGGWVSAAFDPSGALVSAGNGVLTLREAGTALPRATLGDIRDANQPAISPDGRALAYTAGPIDATTQPASQELRIHDWDAATASIGAPRTLAPRRDGEYIKLPDFSPDNRWVVYSRLPALFKSSGSIMIVRADGSAAPIALTPALDDFARFASALGTSPEPMMWIVMKSYRSVGARSQTGIGQLWGMAFYPGRGVASRPFYLPNQRSDVAVLHAPIALP